MNAICYIDGFNLYHGLRSKRWKKYYWLDLWALSERYLLVGQNLVEVVYFTARIKDDPQGLLRQNDFIDALTAHRPNLKVVYGHYLAKQVNCRQCPHIYTRHEEKMTDVNIACRILTDAMDNRFDVALVMSGDSDLVPPVRIIKERWQAKKVIAVFPPDRYSDALKRIAHGQKWIAEADVSQSLLPAQVRVTPSKIISRPTSWL